MILDIPAIISDLVPNLIKGSESISVICIRTTRPKYLVFGEDSDRPALIAQFGDKEALERLHMILSRLHSKVPNLVAEPILLSPWRDNTYLHLQTGLPGTPWFQLTGRYRSREEWAQITFLAHDALERLHVSISSFPDWLERIRPGEELRSQMNICRESGTDLSNAAQDWVARSAEQLDGLDEIRCCWRHGDFCLNNLLVSPSRIAIIDFDEFGETAMPLHDQFGLALSMIELVPKHLLPPAQETDLCATLSSREQFVTQERLPGLYGHYLLWRINQCHDWPTRVRAKASLLARLERAAKEVDLKLAHL